MNTFKSTTDRTKEIGRVTQVRGSVTMVEGLPGARLLELVVLETGELGQVMSLTPDHVEVLMYDYGEFPIGTKVARLDSRLKVPVTPALLGKFITPLGKGFDAPLKGVGQNVEYREVDIHPASLSERRELSRAFESGVSIVDLVVPLAQGQRQLVMGDRKIGKSGFLRQVMLTHALRGGVCVYGGVGRLVSDVYLLYEYLKKMQILDRVVGVVSTAASAPGSVIMTPYTALTVAEYFKDQGNDVVVILDDLTLHAKHYREASLLAHRFPGRNAYPGDIFYAQSRIMERGGQFEKGSITLLPVAETVGGDISGYIQTNLMSMTDGHIFFDQELFNKGRRPSVNAFLSVTRVGHQTQSKLMRSLSRELSSFLVHHEKLTRLTHFGGELSSEVKRLLGLGEQITCVFDQSPDLTVPLHVNAVMIAAIWSGLFEHATIAQIKQRLMELANGYRNDPRMAEAINKLINPEYDFNQFMEQIKVSRELVLGNLAGTGGT